MQVSEKPALFAGPSNEREELAFLLMHHCYVWERATGDYFEDASGNPIWGDGMQCMLTCEVCGAARKVTTWHEFVDWLTVKKTRGSRNVRGNGSAEG